VHDSLLASALSVSNDPQWEKTGSEKIVPDPSAVSLAQEAVNKRYGDKAEVKRDMLGSFVAHGLSKEDAEGETVTQIIAGSDTSATAIRSTMLFVMANPLVYCRLRSEIHARIRDGLISDPITFAESKKFPYLQAVIREGLRMWPPATGLLPKVSAKDELVCGHWIPAGTNVAWAAWSVMRNKAVFGDDADVFRPERWLDAPVDKLNEMEQTVMMEFATGSRWECLGKNVVSLFRQLL
jgi:cytochrome P450